MTCKKHRGLRAALVIALISFLAEGFPAAQSAQKDQTAKPGRRGGFTGPAVPDFVPILGDYASIGVRTAEGRTDIPKLMAALQKIGARDYLHLVWSKELYPNSWDDFVLLAPEFQKAGLRLWLYLVPPSEPPAPEPFGLDYVRWAEECAKLAKRYSCLAGLCMDDFNGNVDKFTPAYCQEMMKAAHTIAPHLAFLVINYFGYYEKSMAEHVRLGAIDGVVFPHFYPQKNHTDTTLLRPQIQAYRAWLDEQTRKGGFSKTMPLVVMVYATKHSQSPDSPTPAFIRKSLEIGLNATDKGLADGVVTYCLPKDRPEFTDAVGAAYKPWRTKIK